MFLLKFEIHHLNPEHALRLSLGLAEKHRKQSGSVLYFFSHRAKSIIMKTLVKHRINNEYTY